MWRRHFGSDDETVESAPDLGRHIVRSLIDEEFDVAHFSQQPEGRSIGEAFLFPYHRYLEPNGVRLLQPVVFNTFEPEQPNQPTPRRCYAFGQALRRAIESWQSPLRVAILASGGLSHFLVDEELDRMTLDALASGDPEAIAALPRKRLRGGNTEARNWIAVAGAMEGLQFELIEYVPVQRSTAGTGAAMAFAHWV
jgi:OH-DDVA oxygenase/3-O-methylgallate 3,4-dioxygenase